MNRKQFLLASTLAGIGLPALPNSIDPGEGTAPVVPAYLKPGDAIGICCPAGFISLLEIQPAVQLMQNWGFEVLTGDTVGKKDFTFGGTDEERANDFQQMLDDPKVKAIMCARGGYGFVRIIDKINFKKFLAHPKWVIGFSDVTVLHCHLHALFGTPTIHSKMCNSFPENWSTAEPIQIDTILSIKDALQGKRMKYPFGAHPLNKQGVAEGVLIGGNLRTIENLAGTRSDFKADGKILFVEDTGEYLYSVDRMFWNLKRTGKLKHLKALIVGGFKFKPDEPGEEFGRSLYQIVLEITHEYNYPIAFDFPVGHQKNNYALKCGIKHRLELGATDCLLREV